MYLDYYGLTEKPFTLSPNPKFLYYSPSHREAVSQFIYSITQQNGFMVLTGEVGAGKTTLIHTILSCLPNDYSGANIFHTVLSPKGQIQNICREFKIVFSQQTMAELIFKLHEYLQRNQRAGKKSILILDEAQNLRADVPEEIRLLSNFEAKDKKFLQTILLGQPELACKLRDESLRQLQDRIGFSYELRRLNLTETREYILHRLQVAGSPKPSALFLEDALDRIYESPWAYRVTLTSYATARCCWAMLRIPGL